MADTQTLNGNSVHTSGKDSEDGRSSPAATENVDSKDESIDAGNIALFPTQLSISGVRRRLDPADANIFEDEVEGSDTDPGRPTSSYKVPKKPRRSSLGDDEDSSSTRDSTTSFDGEDESPSLGAAFPTSPSTLSESASDTGSSPHKKTRGGFNPFKRNSISELKKSGASFLQDCSCNGLKHVYRCLECRTIESGRRGKGQPHLYCRFYGFRKLRYQNTSLTYAGFSDPVLESKTEDIALWLPADVNVPTYLGVGMCKTLLHQVGDQFCDLIHQEKEAITLNLNVETKNKAMWKRVVPGVRDMCDVCDTTLFNYHWACEKCGFVACIACYRSRKSKVKKDFDEEKENECGTPEGTKTHAQRDEFKWLLCFNNKAHFLEELMLTQVIPGDALEKINSIFHKVRDEWKIPQECECDEAKKYQEPNSAQGDPSASRDSEEDEERDEGVASIRSLCARVETDDSDDSDCSDDSSGPEGPKDVKESLQAPAKIAVEDCKDDLKKFDQPLRYFIREGGTSKFHRQQQPTKSYTWKSSQSQFPGLPHSWLCSGQLLKLEDPLHPENMKLFQEMWKRGQPVMVTNINNKLSAKYWTPESFAADCGHMSNDLVNCLSGKTLPCQSIRRFWEGFDNVGKRLKDNDGNPMLLKLKDWPSTGDFAEVLPERFHDLMAALPLTEYTRREGRLNLAARLPDNFVKPDLGPKMYIAYGSGLHLEKGTTNLHLDISDAVNVMVHVGVPQDIDNTEHLAAVEEAIRDSDCERVAIESVLAKIEEAGALWHIYKSSDADKIRDFLNKVAMERQSCLEPDHDPIHDQSWYLDKDLRKRLMAEYGVNGYPIVQCLGDAIFIPAGAPHQVRNLNNCIKIAEDFVSPENVSHCFDLTEEFRRLPETHQNHEDKLQIKNIIYHAVKDALAVLKHSDVGKGEDRESSVP